MLQTAANLNPLLKDLGWPYLYGNFENCLQKNEQLSIKSSIKFLRSQAILFFETCFKLCAVFLKFFDWKLSFRKN